MTRTPPRSTEDLLRDALGAVRAQSRPPADGLPSPDIDATVTPLEGRRRVPPARVLAAAACVALLALVVAIAGFDGQDPDEIDVAGPTLDHDALMERAVEECLAFQAAAPEGPIPDPSDLEALRAWHDQYLGALAGIDDVFMEVRAEGEADGALVDEVLRTLRRQRAAALEAGELLDADDGPGAVAALIRSTELGDQATFALAQAGAPECDPRGVTQPTR